MRSLETRSKPQPWKTDSKDDLLLPLLAHLPVDDHGGELVLRTLAVPLEEEVVQLGVSVHQGHQLLQEEDS